MVRVGYLLSVFYDGERKGAVMKFYDPETEEVFLLSDDTGHRPYLLTDASEGEVLSLAGDSLGRRIVRISRVRKWDPLSLKEVEVTKVEASDPLAIGGSKNSLREILAKAGYSVWEANIKYYECYIYDRKLIPGALYEIPDSGEITPILPREGGILDYVEEESREIMSYFVPLFEMPAPDMRACSIDIEVATPAGQIPSPRDPKRPVIAIAMEGDDGYRKIFLLKRGGSVPERIDGAEVLLYDSEARMIRDAIAEIAKFPVVFSFNGDNFDMPYLARRARSIGLDPRPIRLERDRALIDTGVHVDLYKLYSNRSIQVYVFKNVYLGYTLDEVAQAVVGERKIEVAGGDISSLSLERLARYCFRDAHITYKLGRALGPNLMRLLVLFSRISKLPLEDVARQGISQWIRSMIYFEYRRRGWLIPNREDIGRIRGETTYSRARIRGKKYLGAVVLEPVPGIHFDVSVVDFASLYPSVIKRWRVSFETINCPHQSCRDNRPVEELPHWICREDLGVVHHIIGGLRDLRVNYYKKRSKDPSLSPEERAWYDVVQSSLKVLLNASYGVFGYENFPLYSPPVAETIAALGRKAILTSLKVAREMGLRVIYGDTDSLFLEGATDEELERFIEEVEERLGIDLEVDKHYRYVILSGLKKNYLGVRDDGTVDIKGLMGKKRNVPDLVRKAFNEVIDILRSVRTREEFERAKEEIGERIRSYVERLRRREFTVDEVAFRVVLTRPVDSYVKTTPQHVKAARILRAHGVKVAPGEVIEFVKTRDREGVKPVQLASPEDVDVDKYIEIMETTFEQILDVLGLDVDEILRGARSGTLESYF
mgnify:CR=1 FL=1